MKTVIGIVMIAITTLLIVVAETLANDKKSTILAKVVREQTSNELNLNLFNIKQRKESRDCCEITVKMEKQPSVFKVTLQNKGKEPFYISERTLAKDFVIEIRDAKGQVVPRIVIPKKEGTISVNEGRQVITTIKINEEKTYTLNISKMYKLSSGEFSITLKKTVGLQDGKTFIEITSKPTKFMVGSNSKNQGNETFMRNAVKQIIEREAG